MARCGAKDDITEVSFERDESVITAARRRSLSSASRLEIQWYCFEMPVRFLVHGTNLFAWNWQGVWRETMVLPLLDLAVAGLAALQALREGARVQYGFPDSGAGLWFEMGGGNVRISPTYSDASARAGLDELFVAWERFTDQVRGYLLVECPELAANAFWGAWIYGSAPGAEP